MKTLLKIFLDLLLIGLVSKACNSSADGPSKDPSSVNDADVLSNKGSESEEYVLDATSSASCLNYLKGKSFTGGTARLEFGYDGTVSAYDPGGNLVFGGTMQIGEAMSAVSRRVYVRDMSGGGKLQFLLSNDGKMMEKSSLVIYKPE